ALMWTFMQREATAATFEHPALRLRGYMEHRRSRRVRLPHGCGGIRRAGSRRGDRDAEPPGRARIPIGGVHGRLLVTHDDRADRRAFKSIEDREVVHTRDAEHHF